ncbi:DUF4105 domain-containing protein [Chitinophagaceae bacterium LB-8]|uniref:DUF4105 domain-containing protein n=1 Tax=Paraflavisolibacter caeni TaxID=2982496 RepID=A0A9X3BJD3_9BACT|nr:DUF4105 domain-containing protein [Paraflavisolibacter caeni]MCU7551048.1 DUF4105 domain-containing protein [Paraflavisolibacter caeni]
MKKLFLFLYFTFYIFNTSFSQSCHLRISLLTCAPGEELYSTFGHTALRVTDSIAGTDYVFNYGTFEFGSDFYIQFIRGKLLYYLSVENFNDFVAQYQWESRSIQEQVLQLDCQEKQELYTALQTNSRPENRYYRYDFLFDNCTTRARDIVARNTIPAVIFRNILPKDVPTFRDMIHSYLDRGGQYWSKLGIDILLGAKLDHRVTNQQAMFLPDYLLQGFDRAALGDSASIGKLPLTSKPQTILSMPSPLNKGSLFKPAIVFTLLLVLVSALTFIKANWATAALQVFDFLFFFILGLTGILLLFMWFGTDHVVCQNNFNLLWALPTHVVIAFFVHLKKEWVSKYYKVVFWITILLAAAWGFLPQEMNNALLPLVALILLRSWRLSGKNVKKAF